MANVVILDLQLLPRCLLAHTKILTVRVHVLWWCGYTIKTRQLISESFVANKANHLSFKASCWFTKALCEQDCMGWTHSVADHTRPLTRPFSHSSARRFQCCRFFWHPSNNGEQCSDMPAKVCDSDRDISLSVGGLNETKSLQCFQKHSFSLPLFISLRIWMNLPHITARRWHLWRTPACWESCLSSLDSSGPKMKKTFEILQNKMIKHLLWRDKLCSHLAQCSARFSPCLPARRTLWLRAPRSAQRSYGEIMWHLDLIVARCRVRGPVKLTLCLIIGENRCYTNLLLQPQYGTSTLNIGFRLVNYQYPVAISWQIAGWLLPVNPCIASRHKAGFFSQMRTKLWIHDYRIKCSWQRRTRDSMEK